MRFQISRLRKSVKRAHNLLNLMLPEMNVWRDRILEIERELDQREREIIDSIDQEARETDAVLPGR